MEKSRFLGWMVLVAVGLLWLQYNAKIEMEKQQKISQKIAKAKQDSIAQLGKENPNNSKKPTETGTTPSLPVISEDTTLTTAEPNNALDSVVVEEIKSLEIENKYLKVTLTNEGAKITSLRLKELKSKYSDTLPELLPNLPNTGILTLKLGRIDLSNQIWKWEKEYDSINVIQGQKKFILSTFHPELGKVSRTYIFYADSHTIAHQLQIENWPQSFALSIPEGISETEKAYEGKGIGLGSDFFSEVLTASSSQSVTRDHFKDQKTYNENSGIIRWVGLRRKYSAVIINFKKETDYLVTAKNVGDKDGSVVHTRYALKISSNDSRPQDLNFSIAVLPLKYTELNSYGEGYDRILFSGYDWFFRADVWYVKLCGFILQLLTKFYQLIPNYGVAIILLTLLVRFVLFPLTYAQTKSMSQMQAHAPAIKTIRDKNKGNPQKANLEIMAYYKEKGINPFQGMLGCLPMFLQIPVFISLFHVLGRAVELKEAGFLLWISDLSRPDVILESFTVPYLFPAGLTILPILMALTMYYQTKLTITDPNQKAIVYLMPILMFIFSASFPSGLVLYWTVSNIFTIVQTYLMKKGSTPVVAPSVKK